MPRNELTAGWLRQSPGVEGLLAAATELRLARPHAAAVSLLAEAGAAYPDAFDFLNRDGADSRRGHAGQIRQSLRPARVGAATLARVAGSMFTARPNSGRRTASTRGRPCHFRASPRSIAATRPSQRCQLRARRRPRTRSFSRSPPARGLSLNLDSPDVRACYSEDEIVLAESDEALEAAAEQIVRDPDAALAAGEKARVRTAGEHLWEHRLEKGARMNAPSAPQGRAHPEQRSPHALRQDVRLPRRRARAPRHPGLRARQRRGAAADFLFSEEMAPKAPLAQEAVCEGLRELIAARRRSTRCSAST